MREHQQKIINADPKKCGIFYGTGSGKTRIALGLAQGTTLVVCPKTQFIDGNWEREAEKMELNIDLTVMSKEKFKKEHKNLDRYNTIIFDESHTICGVTPDTRMRKGQMIPKTSQLFEACLWYVKNNQPQRVYLVTATPTRTPMAVWGAGELLGRNNDFYKFRDRFYVRKKMNGYERHLVRKDKETKELLGRLVRKIGYTGKLSDWLDVPDQTEKYVHCPLSKEQESVIKTLGVDYPDPIVLLGKQHQVENGVLYRDEYTPTEYYKNTKIDAVLDLVEEFPKVIVFAKFLAQIEHLKVTLEAQGIPVYILTGAVKDRGEVIARAEKSNRCVFIAQVGISSGYELPSFRCTIFMSASYVHLDLEQARGRNLRMNKLEGAKNLYVYLVSGVVDKAVWGALKNKQDFHEAIFAKQLTINN